ncbi:hypothetical protein [Parabacteroides sp. Marseille-P3160]|uniref:hypothetical protein n=1 Tax=Parabacteroides sp. Marseille-P3160 TaxID=1917887 RepID=UPI0009BB7478|nr:hypothetical protein [Parabacteroides sp. Marseille-P3160]
MKTILKSLFVLIIVLKTVLACGQDKSHVHIDSNYLLGLYEKSDFWTIKSGLSGFDFNIAGMYDINRRLSAGIGVGVEKLYDPSYTILPVFVKVAYSPIRANERPYVFAKVGYGIGTGISNAGLLLNTGLGYKLQLRKLFALNFLLGYHLQSIRYDLTYYSDAGVISDVKKDHNTRHSLSGGIGFIF